MENDKLCACGEQALASYKCGVLNIERSGPVANAPIGGFGRRATETEGMVSRALSADRERESVPAVSWVISG